jgi:hypothetical protein
MRVSLPILLLLLASCAEPSRAPTIQDGVYGRTTTSSDIGGEPDTVYGNVPITVFADASLVAETTSDDDGFYELELVPGHYEICVQNAPPASILEQRLTNCAGKCTYFDVGSEPVALGWAANLSGGWWDGGDHCP